MDAGQDALDTHEPPLGSIPSDPELGPISPELALVDPELARRARELLAEPRERPRPRPPVAPVAPALEPPAEPEARRRRWPRTLALAIVMFVAGAASGTLLGNQQTGAPGTRLEVPAAAPAPRTSTSTRTPKTTTKRAALRPPKVPRATTTAKRPQTRKPKPPRAKTVASLPLQRRRHARGDWATNVLGVEARVGRDGVLLQWLRPADSARVLVLRRQEARSGSTVVYRGRAGRFHDPSARPCTGYRYTIVNVDRRGHRSTGVPTAVTTPCA